MNKKALALALDEQEDSQLTRKSMAKNFARIVVATDGHQVLFYVAANDEDKPVLNCLSQSEDGLEGQLSIAFEDSYAGDALAAKALREADLEMADRIRRQMAPFFMQRAS